MGQPDCGIMKMFRKLAEYRKTVLTAPLLFLIMIAATVLSSVAVTWSDYETRLTTHRGFDGIPSISQTVDGRIWVAWTRSVSIDYSIIYQTSSDEGASWSPETILTTDAGADTSPSIFQDMNGSIWVVWSSDRTGGYDLYYKISSNGGLNWTDANRLTTYPGKDLSPTITQTVNGSIWVVWSSDRTGGYDLYYKISSNGGLNWTDANRLTTNPALDKLPSIAQTSDGNVWISWSSRNEQEEYEIFYITYNGSSWSNETQLTTAPNEVDTDPAILEVLGETILIFWASRGTGPSAQTDDLYYMYSSDNGATWSDRILFTKDSIQYDDTWPTVTQTRDTRIWVVWTSNMADDDYDIYLKTSLAGDVNEDGEVDIFDLTLVAKAYASVVGGPEYDRALDITKDGRVDIRDLSIVSKYYGAT